MPRQPRLARSSTAQTSDGQECSPGSRPITLTRRCLSPKVRSSRLEWRIRCRCSIGKWTCAVRARRLLSITLQGPPTPSAATRRPVDQRSHPLSSRSASHASDFYTAARTAPSKGDPGPELEVRHGIRIRDCE